MTETESKITEPGAADERGTSAMRHYPDSVRVEHVENGWVLEATTKVGEGYVWARRVAGSAQAAARELRHFLESGFEADYDPVSAEVRPPASMRLVKREET